MNRRISAYGRHLIEDDDIAAVTQVLRGDWLTTGPAVAQFERAFAEAVEAPFAVSCSSATAGLHMAAMALQLGPGSAVVVPSVTFLATASGPHFTGADVIFADVDPVSGLLTPEGLEEALTRQKTEAPVRAVFPVHLGGQACDMAGLQDVAHRHGMAVVEDACHALGGSYVAGGEKVTVGSCRHSDMSVFSFHPVKTIAAGEGGMVTARDPHLADLLARARNHGMERRESHWTERSMAFDEAGTPNPWYYEMHAPAPNYRMSDVNAALARSQLAKLGRFVEKRQTLAAHYEALLRDLAPVVQPVMPVPGIQSGWHLFCVLIDFAAIGMTRAVLMARLREFGVGTQVHYIPVHCQPYWKARGNSPHLPGAMAYYNRTLSLPLHQGMDAGDVEEVVDALRKVIDGRQV